jgi:(p)ppGpp synthase/HD superfamily hydrolase
MAAPTDRHKMAEVGEIMRAANFAAIKHRKQKRKDPEGTPYINHPIGVANYLTEVQTSRVPLALRIHNLELLRIRDPPAFGTLKRQDLTTIFDIFCSIR